MALYALSKLDDLALVRGFLLTDPDYAAYALGDLDPHYAGHTTWLAAAQTGEIEGLALLYDALTPPVLFLMGETSALSALLLHGIGPERIFFTALPELESVLRAFYEVDFVHAMFRMRVAPGGFVRLPDCDDHSLMPVPLDERHASQVTELHRAAARVDGRAWEDIAFTPDMLRGGYYQGIFQNGTLLAVAGTHLVAPTERVAAIGNVVVHPDHRRRGLGGLVSQAVTRALLDAGFDRIVLNVWQNNAAAIKIYRRLGFRQVAAFIEGIAIRH